MHRLILLIASLVTAAHAADPAASFQDGKSFSTTGGGYSASSQINDAKGAEVVPGYSGSNSSSQYFQGGDGILSGPAVGKINSCAGASGLTGGHGYAGQECNAIDFVAKNPTTRTQYPISKQDPLLLRADTITENRDAYVPAPGSNLSECVSTVVKSPDRFEVEHCYEYHVVEDHFCAVGRIVEVDRDANYQCTVTTAQKQRQTCYKTLVCISGGTGCGMGGVDVTSVIHSGFGVFRLVPSGDFYKLYMGTIDSSNNFQNNYWGGWHSNIYESRITFNVKNVGMIERIKYVGSRIDDSAAIFVNGVMVWSTLGGTDFRFCQVNSCDWEGSCTTVNGVHDGSKCVTSVLNNGSGHNQIYNTSLDLKGYLREGSNEIIIRAGVGKNGEAGFAFDLVAYCPPICNWDDQCWQLDARTK